MIARFALLLFVVVALGCDGSTRSEADRCCPLEPASCACVSLGGVRPPSGVCPRLCDAARLVRSVDDAGCPYWQAGGGVCGPNIDGAATADAPGD
jgi:hypothetical protein